jgi:hypothetical protein
MQFVVLSGDPKTGEYTQIRKVPPALRIRCPRTAASSRMSLSVASGTLARMRPSAKDSGPGSVVMMPANWVHVSGCRAGSECVFYQEGKGKFDSSPLRPRLPGAKPGQ